MAATKLVVTAIVGLCVVSNAVGATYVLALCASSCFGGPLRSTADFASNLLEKTLIGGKLSFWHWKLSCTTCGYIVLRFAVILSTPMWLALGGWYVFVAVLLYGIGEILDRRLFGARVSAANLQPVDEPVEVPAVANSGGC